MYNKDKDTFTGKNFRWIAAAVNRSYKSSTRTLSYEKESERSKEVGEFYEDVMKRILTGKDDFATNMAILNDFRSTRYGTASRQVFNYIHRSIMASKKHGIYSVVFALSALSRVEKSLVTDEQYKALADLLISKLNNEKAVAMLSDETAVTLLSVMTSFLWHPRAHELIALLEKHISRLQIRTNLLPFLLSGVLRVPTSPLFAEIAVAKTGALVRALALTADASHMATLNSISNTLIFNSNSSNPAFRAFFPHFPALAQALIRRTETLADHPRSIFNRYAALHMARLGKPELYEILAPQLLRSAPVLDYMPTALCLNSLSMVGYKTDTAFDALIKRFEETFITGINVIFKFVPLEATSLKDAWEKIKKIPTDPYSYLAYSSYQRTYLNTMCNAICAGKEGILKELNSTYFSVAIENMIESFWSYVAYLWCNMEKLSSMTNRVFMASVIIKLDKYIQVLDDRLEVLPVSSRAMDMLCLINQFELTHGMTHKEGALRLPKSSRLVPADAEFAELAKTLPWVRDQLFKGFLVNGVVDGKAVVFSWKADYYTDTKTYSMLTRMRSDFMAKAGVPCLELKYGDFQEFCKRKGKKEGLLREFVETAVAAKKR